ncbi:MAG TPA: hypothetical protein IGR64_03135 [Leptolyngbyaceae cyanobacterium M65_K2018_010]|nr:hypothetical protein [Leptolyngbyaceae cyanobacterium M65_K2018_010]
MTAPTAVHGQGFEAIPPLPAGVIPVPSGAMPQTPASGQQYLVFVNGNSEALLAQVRAVEPTAFRTTYQGQPVIQAGAFNFPANAQQRAADLASRAMMTQVAQVPARSPAYAQTPALPTNVYAASGELPPLPTGVTVLPPPTTGVPVMPPEQGNSVVVVPGNSVEFGQQPSYGVPTAASASTVTAPPPSHMAVAAPTAAAAVPTSSPYYVVIPTAANELQAVSSRVIQLGTPPDRVQALTEPRGPHVSIGPFADLGLAEQWNRFYREAGLKNSRVFFQR